MPFVQLIRLDTNCSKKSQNLIEQNKATLLILIKMFNSKINYLVIERRIILIGSNNACHNNIGNEVFARSTNRSPLLLVQLRINR